MSVRLRLIIIVLFVALVPLSVSALSTLGIHQRAFDQNLAELHRTTAKHEAARLGAQLGGMLRSLRVLATKTIQWSTLSAEERTAALWLVYRQDPDVMVALLLDQRGQQLGPAARIDEAGAAEEPAHLPASGALVERLKQHLPAPKASAISPAWGEPFVADPLPTPVLPLLFEVASPDPAERWRVAIGLSLRGLCSGVNDAAGMNLIVADAQARRLCA